MSTFRDAAASIFSGSTGAANKPSGVVSDDVMIALVVGDGVVSTLVIYAPDGTTPWTLLGSVQQITAGGDTHTAAVYYRVAGGSESSTYSVANSNASDTAIVIAAYSDVDTTTPIAASSVNNPGGGATASPVTATGTSINTTAANQTVLFAATIDWNNGNAMSWGSLGSLTSRGQATPANFSNGIIADLVQVSAGATGALSATGTNTGASAQYIAWQIALLDAGGGGSDFQSAWARNSNIVMQPGR